MSAHSTHPTDGALDAQGDAESAAGELPLDEVFHLLQSNRRRLTLRFLRGTDSTVDMRDVVEGVASEEYDTPPDRLDSTERQRVYISLYQRHLPKLDEAGVIRYEQDRGDVERTPLADELDEYLPGAHPAESGGVPAGPGDAAFGDRQWTRYYEYVTAGSLALVVAGWAGLLPASLTSGVGLAALIVGAFAALTLGRRVDRAREPTE